MTSLGRHEIIEKIFQKVLFSCTYKGMLPSAASSQMTSLGSHKIMFATVHVTDDDVRFCDGPGMHMRKTTNP